MRQARKTQRPSANANEAKTPFPVSRIISMQLDEGKLPFVDALTRPVRWGLRPLRLRAAQHNIIVEKPDG
jgi:hypothetical protein